MATMSAERNSLALVGGLWLAVMAAALWARPPLPVDETRYLAVAWEMWLKGDWLVPHLNGEPYSHKPPLLFWLFNLGWWAFGVNDWWPRLIAPLAGLLSLLLTARLARLLWPADTDAATLAPPLLFGGLFWALFTTLTMFDMLLALFALMALEGLVRAARAPGVSGFAVAGLAIGLGALAKGPAILVHVLPVALAAPWWAGRLAGEPTPPLGGRWWAGVAAAVAVGFAIGLAWALPAGAAGGPAYRDAILWGQSAGRLVDSFAHAEPWWLYLVALPALLLPWTAWPIAWRAVRRLGADSGDNGADGGVRLCAVWLVAALVTFSAISGKQFHYLLPEFPALALVFARLLAAETEVPPRALDAMLPALLLAAAGAAMVALPAATALRPEAPWLDILAVGWGVLPVAAAVAIIAVRRWPLAMRVGALATATAVVVVAAHLALRPVLAAYYDVGPVARRLAEWQADGVAVAHFGKYHGQYHFPGRLTKPLAVIGVVTGDQAAFLAAHPRGRIVAYHDALPRRSGAAPLAVFPFRSRLITLWDAATVAADPTITRR